MTSRTRIGIFGVMLLAFLITTNQQIQESDLKEDHKHKDPFLVPYNFDSASQNSQNSPSSVQINPSPTFSSEEVLATEKNPSVASVAVEPSQTQTVGYETPVQSPPSPDIPLALPEDLLLSPLVIVESGEANVKVTETVANEEPAGHPELEPGVSAREDLERISVIIEQDVVRVPVPEGNQIYLDEDGKFIAPGSVGNEQESDATEPQKNDSKVGGEGSDTDTDTNKSVEDSIPSFSEWTKLQLAQRKESIINNIKDKASLQEGKNFASPDCGAKIVASNPEAQNPSGAISSSHDEYMLNRCTVNTWLVVELCEPLRVQKVSLGNLELFSSSPNEFELGVSDRYPSRDWTTIGPFFAPAFRNLHSFQLPANDSTFGKFLRVVVKSHHGKEHYCPLSLIKVFGRSEYEVLESETTHAEDVAEANSNNPFEEEPVGDGIATTQSVLSSATEAVMEMVKKAANALVYNASEITPPPADTRQTCYTITQCVSEVERRDNIIHHLSCQSERLEWLQRILSWCGWIHCHEFLKTRSIGSPWMTEGLIVAIYGPTIIDSLCHFKRPLSSCNLTEDEKVTQLTSGVPNDTQSNEPAQISVPAIPPATPPQTNEQPQQPQLSEQQPPPQVNPPVTMEEPVQKESVFVRLSNRIKNLERNQSLSSGYLEELSRRFKKQSEELSLTHELFRKALNESQSMCRNVQESLRFHVKQLTRNNENLRELLGRVELQRGGMVFFAILQFVCTIWFCWMNRRRTPDPTVGPENSVTNSRRQNEAEPPPAHLVLQRKRTNSDRLKKVKKKKKKNEGFLSAPPTANGGLKFEFHKAAPILVNNFSSNSSSSSTSTSTSNVPRSTTAQSNLSSNDDESQPAIKKKSKLFSLMSFGNKN